MSSVSTQKQTVSDGVVQPMASKQKKTIQTKLTIGSANDRYEREADAMADRIMRMPQNFSSQPLSNGAKGIQRACSACAKEEDNIRRKPLMMKSEGGTPVATAALSAQLGSSKGSGNPLPLATNSFMSKAFGADFSNVRVHTDSRAVQMNNGLQARAFAHGSDIYFNRGEYNPNSSKGKRLLGHELTHVVQQGGERNLQLKSHIQRACQAESHYSSASNYCRDDTFSPATHPGKTCYRQIPVRSSYFSCPAGEHVCFESDGTCEDSPDKSSLAEGKESDGSCNWNSFCVAEHTAVDFVPAVAESLIPQAFKDIGNEALRGLDWHNWVNLP